MVAQPSKDRAREHGFVLVVVILICGLFAAFTLAVTMSVRSHTLYTRNALSEVLAKSIADGLVQLTALQFAYADGTLPADGRWRSCRWEDEAQAWVSLQDQSGLVDLNTASPDLMLALLKGLGLSHTQAADMTNAMRDFRDADRVSDFGQEEAPVYSGRSYGPKNAPFEAIEELDQLPGMTPELFAELRDLTTTYTQQTGFDFGTAPERLLEVLQLSRNSAAGLPFSSPRSANVSAITAAVQINDGTRFVRRALIERTDQPQRPFVIRSWEGGVWPLLKVARTPSKPCFR